MNKSIHTWTQPHTHTHHNQSASNQPIDTVFGSVCRSDLREGGDAEVSDGALHDHTPVLHKHLGEKKKKKKKKMMMMMMLLLLLSMMKREKREKEEE